MGWSGFGAVTILVTKYRLGPCRERRDFRNLLILWCPGKDSKSHQGNPTLEELSKIYLKEYCQPKNRDAKFKERQLEVITRILGRIRVKELTRADAYKFITKRSKEVSPASVNRGLAVLKHLMTFALDKGDIDNHPLQRFSLLPEPKKALRVMTLQEERSLVEAVAREDLAIGS